MQTNLLKRDHPNRKRMTVARGGKRGKTSGRGGKGQTARAGNKRRPEWRDIIKKLPKLRGRGKNSNKTVSTQRERPIGVGIAMIEAAFEAGALVNPGTLLEQGVIATWSGRTPKVKILGGAKVTKSFKVSGCTVSESARAEIMKAGGSIEAMKPVSIQKPAKVATGPSPEFLAKEAALKEESKKKSAEAKKADKKPIVNKKDAEKK